MWCLFVWKIKIYETNHNQRRSVILYKKHKKYERNAKNKDGKILKTENDNLILSSKCAVCGSKKSSFMKEQEAEGLLSNLRIKTPLSKIPLLNVLF